MAVKRPTPNQTDWLERLAALGPGHHRMLTWAGDTEAAGWVERGPDLVSEVGYRATYHTWALTDAGREALAWGQAARERAAARAAAAKNDTSRRVGGFAVGDRCYVHAYGRTRVGTVVKLGKTRVTVDFARNANGDRAKRDFAVTQVKPFA